MGLKKFFLKSNFQFLVHRQNHCSQWCGTASFQIKNRYSSLNILTLPMCSVIDFSPSPMPISGSGKHGTFTVNNRDRNSVTHAISQFNLPSTAAGLLFIYGVFNKIKCNHFARTELGMQHFTFGK